MKNNTLLPMLAATATVALAAFGATPLLAADTPPGGSISVTGTLTATVTAIDAKDRWVTLKMADGTMVDVQAGPKVKNFAQIKVGDLVTAEKQETVSITVVPAGQAAPSVSSGSSTVSAPLGDKPMGVEVDTTVVTGAITAIDAAKRLVTLKGPLGNSHTVMAGPEVKRFNELKVGDNVVISVKTATMIEVTSPAKKPAKP